MIQHPPWHFFSLYFCVAYAKVPHCVPFICKSSRKLRKIDYLVIYLAAYTTAGQIINNTVSACAIVHSACSNEDRMGIRNKSVVLVRPASGLEGRGRCPPPLLLQVKAVSQQ